MQSLVCVRERAIQCHRQVLCSNKMVSVAMHCIRTISIKRSNALNKQAYERKKTNEKRHAVGQMLFIAVAKRSYKWFDNICIISRSRLNDYISILFLAYLSIWHIWQCLGEHISLCQWCSFIVCSHLLNEQNEQNTGNNKNADDDNGSQNKKLCASFCVVRFVDDFFSLLVQVFLFSSSLFGAVHVLGCVFRCHSWFRA